MSHTPGPWEVWTASAPDLYVNSYKADPVAKVDGSLADANLIAAAPDLLEALEEIRSNLARLRDPNEVETIVLQIADDAIAKAESKVRI